MVTTCRAPLKMKVDIFNTTNKYKTIYADPPWMERGAGKYKRGADKYYSLMKTSDIKALPVSQLYDPEIGCHLYLWTTNNFIPDALEVMRAWGFWYIITITWIKNTIGIGQYYRGITEHCLFGRTPKLLPYKVDDLGKEYKESRGFMQRKRFIVKNR